MNKRNSNKWERAEPPGDQHIQKGMLPDVENRFSAWDPQWVTSFTWSALSVLCLPYCYVPGQGGSWWHNKQRPDSWVDMSSCPLMLWGLQYSLKEISISFKMVWDGFGPGWAGCETLWKDESTDATYQPMIIHKETSFCLTHLGSLSTYSVCICGEWGHGVGGRGYKNE